MKEIGGYFGLEPLISKEYYPDLVAVNNARNGLLYLLKARKIKKLFIPYFLCDSVSGVCDREGYSYEYYNITPELLPDFDKALAEGEYLYVVNYYGQLDNDKARSLKNQFGNIIFDNVQAFFQKPIAGVDTLYSCRKFFGVPDGGYVSTNATWEGTLPTDVSMDRMKHVLGRFEGERASDYYSDFKASDQSFAELPLRAMSKLTHNLLGAIAYDAVKAKREENFAVLDARLASVNRLKLSAPQGPYAYPLLCENSLAIKKRLAEQKIYVPTLWPEVAQMRQPLERELAENILPLPCDQRYGQTDMERIVSTVLQCMN